MNKIHDLKDLAQLTELAFSACSAELQKLTKREVELRERFRQLEAQRKNASSPVEDVLEHRLTGLDVLYQMWVGKQLSDLNAELAVVLAEKEKQLGELRVKFGKKNVSKQLLEREIALKRPGERGW